MDYPHRAWVFFSDLTIRVEDVLRVLAGRGLAVNFRKSQVEVELPVGPGSVEVTLRHGPRVRQYAARLAEEADPSWGWLLAKCESAFVVTCYDIYQTPRLEVMNVWEEVAALIQAMVGGIQYSYSDPDSDRRFVPPHEPD